MDPATWTAIGTAVSIGSSVIGAVGAFADARGQSQIAEYNAQVQEQEAVAVQKEGDYQAGILRERQRRFMASQRAAAGAQGVTLQGAPAELISEGAADARMDEMALRYSTSVQAARARAQAAVDRMQARSLRQQGYFGAGRSLLTGATALASQFGE